MEQEQRFERIRLACPDCGTVLDPNDRCTSCSRRFERGRTMDLRPVRSAAPPLLELGSKFHGRLGAATGLKRRLFELLSPNPVRFIDDAQRTHGKNAHGSVLGFARDPAELILDLGSGDRRLHRHVYNADIDTGRNIDFQLDAHRLPFPPETWDRIVLQHVLEHVADPARVIAEVHRVLRPGGLAYVEVPFLYPVHHRADLRRWTVSGLRADLGVFSEVTSGITIGPFTTSALIARSALTHRIASTYLAAAVDILVGWLLYPVRFLDLLAPPVAESQIGAGAVYIIARKSGRP